MMPKLAKLLLLLLLNAPQMVQGNGVFTSSCDIVRYETYQTQTLLPTIIAGKKLKLLLDTGGGKLGLAMHPFVLKKMKTLTPTGKSISSGGVNGNIQRHQAYTLPLLTIGTTQYQHLSTVKSHNWGVGRSPAAHLVDGIIGLGAMSQHDFTLHPAKQTLYIGTQKDCEAFLPGHWTSSDMVFDDNGIHVQVEIKGAKKNFLLDTAATVSVIDPSAIPEGLQIKQCASLPGSKGCLQLKNGDASFVHYPVKTLHVLAMPYLTEDGIDGILGADFLSRFAIHHGFSTKVLGIATVD